MLRIILIYLLALVLGAGAALQAQEHPARRLSSIVGVAVEEYSKGVDESGRITSDLEYQEAVDFLRDAREVATRLAGDRARSARPLLDTLSMAIGARKTPREVATIYQRFVSALGSEGALELPRRALNVVNGRQLYQANCASCHGERGLGDGVLASGMTPFPPAIGKASEMQDATPALLYRVISVGIPGTPMPAWAARFSAEDRWDIVAYMHTLRSTQGAVLEGEGLFLQGCASCHGATGGADGAAAVALTRLPEDIGTFGWQVERSDKQIAAVIREGIPGSAMPPSHNLSDSAVAKTVAYIRSLPVRSGEAPGNAIARNSGRPADFLLASRNVLSLLDQSLAAAHSGKVSDAGDRAFDAYIAFEPLETPGRAKNPGLVASMERHFADFKGAVRGGDLRAARQSREAIAAGMPAILDLTQRATGSWAAFLQSLLIILREGFEAILVVGAIVTFLIKTGNRRRLRAIWLGCGLALAASAVTAVVLQTALRAMPATREIIEGVTMLIAVVVLFSVSYWLISKVEAARWQKFIRDKVSAALEQGGGRALAIVAFLAVYREGAETALFYQALFAEGRSVAVPIALGIVVGIAALAVIFTIFHRFGVRIPLRPFFAATSVMLYFLAFVFAGKGIRELQEGDAVSITMLPGFPSIDALGIFPTVETLLIQFVLVMFFAVALLKTFWPTRSAKQPAPVVVSPVNDLAGRVAALQSRVEALEIALQNQFVTSDAEPADR
ncbi:MAG: FTR1 family protein [Anaerolineae bacterium]|nr:FTR1 family protein [Gemmatimonadaceae bacterium]